jgi:hypothetical protein
MTKNDKHNWSRLDATTDEEWHAAALSDLDAQPLMPEDFSRMKRPPQVRVIRRALGLSLERPQRFCKTASPPCRRRKRYRLPHDGLKLSEPIEHRIRVQCEFPTSGT